MIGVNETQRPLTNNVKYRRPDTTRRFKDMSTCLRRNWQLVHGGENQEGTCPDCEKLSIKQTQCLRCDELFTRGCKTKFICITCYNVNKGKDD